MNWKIFCAVQSGLLILVLGIQRVATGEFMSLSEALCFGVILFVGGYVWHQVVFPAKFQGETFIAFSGLMIIVFSGAVVAMIAIQRSFVMQFSIEVYFMVLLLVIMGTGLLFSKRIEVYETEVGFWVRFKQKKEVKNN